MACGVTVTGQFDFSIIKCYLSKRLQSWHPCPMPVTYSVVSNSATACQYNALKSTVTVRSNLCVVITYMNEVYNNINALFVHCICQTSTPPRLQRHHLTTGTRNLVLQQTFAIALLSTGSWSSYGQTWPVIADSRTHGVCQGSGNKFISTYR